MPNHYTKLEVLQLSNFKKIFQKKAISIHLHIASNKIMIISIVQEVQFSEKETLLSPLSVAAQWLVQISLYECCYIYN